MLLVIDAGNTNVEFAVFDGTKLKKQWRADSSQRKTADEWALWLVRQMEQSGIKPEKVTTSVMSCVVPFLQQGLSDLCAQQFGGKPRIVGQSRLQLGFDIDVDTPSEVGADLLCATAAAVHFYDTPCLILDMGTATTLSLIDDRPAFCGVAIAPGLAQSQQVLTDGAALLSDINWEKADNVIGRDTITALQGGVFWGYLGLVEKLITKAIEQYKAKNPKAKDLKIIATGGFARHIVPYTDLIDAYDPDLVLKGLQTIDQLNPASS